MTNNIIKAKIEWIKSLIILDKNMHKTNIIKQKDQTKIIDNQYTIFNN